MAAFLIPVAIGIATSVLTAVLAPSPPRQRQGKIEDTGIPEAEYGFSLSLPFGRVEKEGLKMMWGLKLKEKRKKRGGKGGQKTETFTYFLTAAYPIAREIEYVRRVWMNGILVYTHGSNDKKSQKFLECCTIYTGNQTSPSSVIQANETNPVPAFTGWSYLVFNNYPLAEFNGNGFPKIDVEVVGEGGENPKIRDILRKVCKIAGIAENKIDVSGVPDNMQIEGFDLLFEGTSFADQIGELLRAFFLITRETKDKIIFKQQRTSSGVESIPKLSLGAKKFGDRPIDLYEIKQTHFREIPSAVTVSGSNVLKDYDNISVTAKDPSARHENELTIQTRLISTDNLFTTLASRVLFLGRTQSKTLSKMFLLPAWDDLAVGDLISSDSDRLFHREVLQITKKTRGAGYLIELEATRFQGFSSECKHIAVLDLHSFNTDAPPPAIEPETLYSVTATTRITSYFPNGQEYYSITNTTTTPPISGPIAFPRFFRSWDSNAPSNVFTGSGASYLLPFGDGQWIGVGAGVSSPPSEDWRGREVQQFRIVRTQDGQEIDTSYYTNRTRIERGTVFSPIISYRAPLRFETTLPLGQVSPTPTTELRIYDADDNLIFTQDTQYGLADNSTWGVVTDCSGIDEITSDFLPDITVNNPFESEENPAGYGSATAIVIECPPIESSDADLGIYVAIEGDADYRAGALFYSEDGGESYDLATAITGESVTGTVLSFSANFNNSSPAFIDDFNWIRVRMDSGEIEPVTLEKFLSGKQLGWFSTGEILAFKNAEIVSNSPLTFDISYTIRGLKGTEAFIDNHAIGERFVLLTDYLVRLPVDTFDVNRELHLKVVPDGLAETEVDTETIHAVKLESVKPFPAVVTSERSGGDVIISWYRRTRLNGRWTDYIDIPYAAGELDTYTVRIYDGDAVKREFATGAGERSVTYTATQQAADWGSPRPSYVVRVFQNSSYPVTFKEALGVSI
jgi:hypothetical protein